MSHLKSSTDHRIMKSCLEEEDHCLTSEPSSYLTKKELPALPDRNASIDRSTSGSSKSTLSHPAAEQTVPREVEPRSTSTYNSTLTFTEVDFILDFAQSQSIHQKELEDLKKQLQAAQDRNRDLQSDISQLYHIQEAYDEQLEQAKSRASDLLMENLSLKKSPQHKSDKSLISDFRSLVINIESWCEEASFNAKPRLLDERQITEMCESLSLGHTLGLRALEVNQKACGQAVIWRILSDHIFHADPSDTGKTKDLWTCHEEAEHLSAIERRLTTASDMTHSNLNRWRALTIGALSQQAAHDRDRIGFLNDRLFGFLSSLFGFQDMSKVRDLQDELKSAVLGSAVELSKDMRGQESRIYIRLLREDGPGGAEVDVRGERQSTTQPVMIKELENIDSEIEEIMLAKGNYFSIRL